MTSSLQRLALRMLLIWPLCSGCQSVGMTERIDVQPEQHEISGTYWDEAGVVSFEFADGQVRMDGGIVGFEGSYEILENQIAVRVPRGREQRLTIRSDGSLDGEFGTLRKKKE